MANRDQGLLNVTKVWSEPGVKWTSQRIAKLEAELSRFARFVSIGTVDWVCPQPGS